MSKPVPMAVAKEVSEPSVKGQVIDVTAAQTPLGFCDSMAAPNKAFTKARLSWAAKLVAQAETYVHAHLRRTSCHKFH